MIQGRTSFVIAHRLSTVREADLILYMMNGNIVESGTHEQLLSSGGHYAQLYYSQFALSQ
ncbi:putative multidrug resistance ABC transporter ATP-binding/permease protein YheH [compost metagenome]